jgi:hypothetical protein
MPVVQAPGTASNLKSIATWEKQMADQYGGKAIRLASDGTVALGRTIFDGFQKGWNKVLGGLGKWVRFRGPQQRRQQMARAKEYVRKSLEQKYGATFVDLAFEATHLDERDDFFADDYHDVLLRTKSFALDDKFEKMREKARGKSALVKPPQAFAEPDVSAFDAENTDNTTTQPGRGQMFDVKGGDTAMTEGHVAFDPENGELILDDDGTGTPEGDFEIIGDDGTGTPEGDFEIVSEDETGTPEGDFEIVSEDETGTPEGDFETGREKLAPPMDGRVDYPVS